MFFTSLLEGNVGKVSDASSSFWRGLIGSAGSSSAGVRVTPESALALPVIQNCVTLLAESLAQLPLELYERQDGGQRQVAVDHPLYQVLRYQPNPFQTPYDRVELSQMSAGLRGNSYSLIPQRQAMAADAGCHIVCAARNLGEWAGDGSACFFHG